MAGATAVSGSSGPDWEEIQRRQQAANAATPASPSTASTSRTFDPSALPDDVQTYDPSMFTNVDAANAVTSNATKRLADKPDPLPPAADAYRGIQLFCLAEDLPATTRSDMKNAFTIEPYRMEPVVRVHEDGSASLLYWVAVNRDAKRAEFVVGPGQLEQFKANVTAYARAGATTYAAGEPNEWQRQSLKTVDDAMRKGVMYGLQSLNRAWLAAVQDPNFWGQTALNVATAMAGGGAAARVESEVAEEAPKELPPGPGPHSPTVEGGLRAHEGGPPNGHTLEKHVGKTEAQLRARFTEVEIGRNGRPMRPPSSNSAFYNRAIAEANIAKTMEMNEAQIKEWLANPDGPRTIRFNNPGAEPAFPVGVRVLREGGPAQAVAGTRVVLVRDPSTAAGFRILTAFPIP